MITVARLKIIFLRRDSIQFMDQAGSAWWVPISDVSSRTRRGASFIFGWRLSISLSSKARPLESRRKYFADDFPSSS